ncbi:hypothetical protein CIRG_00978 [Coccidioides immitis RMSCC 2394]|uniref:Uncharacterized protein n=1 Tax=Coccidioides immitis RMSCC 2394 TaxID=404692 RepID=A0A0J6XXA1_COCIT|nr:hypothetical protein CIRG_00978 [Coccidioides immitis RMSCC 2394]
MQIGGGIGQESAFFLPQGVYLHLSTRVTGLFKVEHTPIDSARTPYIIDIILVPKCLRLEERSPLRKPFRSQNGKEAGSMVGNVSIEPIGIVCVWPSLRRWYGRALQNLF